MVIDAGRQLCGSVTSLLSGSSGSSIDQTVRADKRGELAALGGVINIDCIVHREFITPEMACIGLREIRKA